MLGVAWSNRVGRHRPAIRDPIAAEDRLVRVDAKGLDEHVWRHVGPPKSELLTGIVDHSGDENGRPRTRLLDLVPDRTARVTRTDRRPTG